PVPKHWPHSVHTAAALEDSVVGSHDGALFSAHHFSFECSVRRRILSGRNARSDTTRRRECCEKRDVFDCGRNDPDGSRILARPRDEGKPATIPELPNARVVCNSGNRAIDRTGPPL